MEHPRQKVGSRTPGDRVPEDRSIADLLRAIARDTATLVRKEVELARHELKAAVSARLKAGAALAVAGVLGIIVIVFLGLAAARALDLVLPGWASRLIVAGIFLLLALGAAAFGALRVKRPPMAPQETKRTVKEDVQWAKTRLRR